MDDATRVLWDACAALGCAPPVPFPSVQDFEAHVLQLHPGRGAGEKHYQEEWLKQAILAARQERTDAVIMCLKQIKALA